jgi:DNA-binding NarL/FixJ family response regulator
MKPARRITVLLAEDHAIVRDGLRKLLEAESDIEVVGEAANGRQAVEMARKLRPAVVVMDIAMLLLNGFEATRQIRQAVHGAKVLVLSDHGDDAYVERATALGAAGYLIKQTSANFLSEAIREVRKGNTFFSPSISKSLRHHNRKPPDRKGRLKAKSEIRPLSGKKGLSAPR